MIPTAIFREHEGKLVSIYTHRNTFEGVLEIRNSGSLLVLKARDEWAAKCYGHTYVDTISVVAIKEIKPRSKKDCDEEADDCCEKDSPKAYAKRSTEDKQLLGQDPTKSITSDYVISKDTK